MASIIVDQGARKRLSETRVTDPRAIASLIGRAAHQGASAATIITERDGSTVAVIGAVDARRSMLAVAGRGMQVRR